MFSLLLFSSIALGFLALLVLWGAVLRILDPFSSDGQFVFAFLAFLVLAPAVIVGSYNCGDAAFNYCPPLEPIAAPDFADVEAPSFETFETFELIPPPAPPAQVDIYQPSNPNPILFDEELITINEKLAEHLDRVQLKLAAANERIAELEAFVEEQGIVTLAESNNLKLIPIPNTDPIQFQRHYVPQTSCCCN